MVFVVVDVQLGRLCKPHRMELGSVMVMMMRAEDGQIGHHDFVLVLFFSALCCCFIMVCEGRGR